MDSTLAAVLGGRGPDELLFPAPRGGALRVRNMRRDWFDHSAVAAGVGGLTPHELRHTAASMAVSAGASVLALQRMLGHEKASITLDAVADRMASARADFLRTKQRPSLHAVSAY